MNNRLLDEIIRIKAIADTGLLYVKYRSIRWIR